MPDDGVPISKNEVEAAASVGRLPALARQLVLDQGWLSLEVLFGFVASTAVPIEDLTECALAVQDTIAPFSEQRRLSIAGELAAVRRLAAHTLLRKVRTAEPAAVFTTTERRALGLAAEFLFELGELRRAAEIFERAGNDVRAADAYGALGAIEQMELCLAREESARGRRLATADALRQFDILLASGERVAALRVAATVGDDQSDARQLRGRAREIERRLLRARALTVLLPDGMRVRVAGVPAVLGRDGTAQVMLRDPSVSRRHATIVAGENDTLAVEDAGSRTGTRIAGVGIAGRVALTGAGTLGLGTQCELAYRPAGPGVIELRGAKGLDRSVHALLGRAPVSLAIAVPAADGVFISFDGGYARLLRAEDVRVRVDGRLIGRQCDLLIDDQIEIGETDLRLRVSA